MSWMERHNSALKRSCKGKYGIHAIKTGGGIKNGLGMKQKIILIMLQQQKALLTLGVELKCLGYPHTDTEEEIEQFESKRTVNKDSRLVVVLTNHSLLLPKTTHSS